MKHITIATLLFILCSLSFANNINPSTWKKGKGTKKQPYLIESAEHLYFLSYQVNNGNRYEDVYFLVSTTIDIQGDEKNQWIPIGNRLTPFGGNFNGNNFEITNLYVATDSLDYIGLFGSVYAGIIENTGISEKSFLSGKNYVGGIVGYQMGGSIRNCYNKAFVNGENNVGGIVGYQYSVCVSSCYNSGTIHGKECVGGIIGLGYAKTSIRNCYNTGWVQQRNAAGGIAGKIDGYIYLVPVENCYQQSLFNKIGLIGVGIHVESSNCYYTNVSGMQHCPFGTPLPNEEMKSIFFLAKLNNGQKIWIQDNEPYVNSGYPILMSAPYVGVFTHEAGAIGQEEATLYGNFVLEKEPILSKGFEYREENATEFIHVVVDSTLFSYHLEHLIPYTNYEYRAFVVTGKEIRIGRTILFQTLPEHHQHDEHNHK
jgi:hypothetical protein